MLNRTRRRIRICVNVMGALIAATGLWQTAYSGSGKFWLFLIVLGYIVYKLIVDTRRNLFRDTAEDIEGGRAEDKKRLATSGR